MSKLHTTPQKQNQMEMWADVRCASEHRDYRWLSFPLFYTSGFPKTHVTCVINCLQREKKVLLGKSESWRGTSWHGTGVATGAQGRGAGRRGGSSAPRRVKVGTAPSGRLKQTKSRTRGLEGPLGTFIERWSFRKDGAQRVRLNGLAVWIRRPVRPVQDGNTKGHLRDAFTW